MFREAERRERKLRAVKTNPKQSTELRTRREAGAELRYSVRSIDALIARGELPVVRFAGKTLIRASAIAAFITRHEHAATRAE